MIRCLNCMKEYEGFDEECPYCGFIQGTPAIEGFHLNPGVELKERYIVGTVVSYGGFGVVYAGWDTMLKCKVAVKEYFPSGLITREPGKTQVYPVKNESAEREYELGKKRFLREAKIMSKYDGYETIVSIMDYFEENGTAYIIMEFLEGQTLKEYIKSTEELGERVDIQTAVDITIQICDVLAELHKDNILHRDIAPDNIYICIGGKIKLIDFGAARLAEKDKQLTKVLKMGFAPPEQYSTDKEQGTYTDVYALGATLYRTITGQMPDEASNRASLKQGAIAKNDTLKAPKDINPDISEQLSNTILRAMAITPGMRFQTMQEFKEALQGKTAPLDPKKELLRRKQRRIITGGLVCLLLAGGIFVGIRMFNNKKIAAELPEASIEVCVPVSESNPLYSEENTLSHMKNMVSEFKENYPHVMVEIETASYEQYAEEIENHISLGDMPVLYLEHGWQQQDKNELAVPTCFEKYVDNKDYYYWDQMHKMIQNFNKTPTGYIEIVLYEKKDAPQLSDEQKIQLLETQCTKGFEVALNEFQTGASQYLIAGTDYYYQFFENTNADNIVIDHVINAGNVKIEPFQSEKKFGCFSDYWCINQKAKKEEQDCANVLLAYFLEGNCQRSYFTVEAERQSQSAPLLKEVFDENYFQNMMVRKMPFLKENMAKMIFINQYTDINDFYNQVLNKIKEN